MQIKEFIESLEKSNFLLAIENEKLILKGNKNKLPEHEIQAIKSNQYVINYIREHKNELIEYLSQLPEKLSFEKKSKNISSIYLLSGLQQGMLFHGLYDRGVGAYRERFVCDLIRPDLQIFRKSWDYILKRHSILRSVFYYDQFKVPVQCVYQEVEFPMEILDFQTMSGEEQAAAIKKYEEADRQKGFDFKAAPLMRLGLIRLRKDRYRMLWTYHHILFDGWSMQVLMEEFLSTYELLLSGKEVVTGEEDRYEDYIRYIERRDKEQDQFYWSNYLKGVEHGTLLPFIGTTTERNKGVGAYSSIILQIDADTTARIQNYTQKYRITINTVMQGVWSYLLHRYTGNSDVVYGVIVSGRPDDLPGVEHRVGMYINALPLRSVMQEEESIVKWLQKIQQQQVSSRQYQYTPLNDIRGWAKLQGDLFDSLLVFDNYPVSKVISAKQWSLGIENVHMQEHNNYPLSINIFSAQEINLFFSYNSDFLGKVYSEQIAKHFEHVLLQFINQEGGMLCDIELLTQAGKHQLLKEFNNTEVAYPPDKTIVDLFEEQAVKTPDYIAVIFEEQQLSYQELNERANQLAHYLRSRGVKEETLVPICVDRSLELIIGILGILKAGGAYVPIDSDYPQERIRYMLKDLGCNIIVTSIDHLELFNSEMQNAELLCIDDTSIPLPALSTDKLSNTLTPDNLAYVIYTSGSTGQPKGVMVTHKNVVSLVRDIDYVSLDKEDILLSTGSPSFDATTFEYWGILLNGGQLILCTENRLLDSKLLKEEIVRRGVTKMWFTSSWFNQLVDTDIGVFEGLETILVGGEKLSEQHIKQMRQLYPLIEIINGYGPTENTTFSLTYKITDTWTSSSIPIGRPLSNRSAYVLDKQRQLVPVGVTGEICIGGAGLARGYLNRKELTEEKFIANPFSRESESRLYKTGDLGRWLPDGNIEYLGRIDDQLKIRGYRIEPGEIENMLQQSELVSQAVVLAREDKEGNKHLVGYVVAEGMFNREAITSYLKAKLPEYMVPALWVQLETLPLTVNGKIDRKALPDPDASGLESSEYVAPRSEVETKLAEIWQELLDVERVGVQDNFFELGGDSLLAIRLISAIRRELVVEMPISDIFEYPTISLLAAQLPGQSGTTILPYINVEQRPEHIPLSFSQERLWFIDRFAGSVQYHIPAVLRLKGKLNKDAITYSLQDIVNRHEVLRTVILEYEGEAYQYIKDKDGWELAVVDGSEYRQNREALQNYIQRLIKKPFDLSKDYMIRGHLISLDEQEHVLVVIMHHIASDGWSRSVLVKEVIELYESYEENRPARLAPLQIHYADYSIWQRKYLQGELLERKINYWKDKLQGVAPMQLPSDYARPAVSSMRGAAAGFSIDKRLSEQLQLLSQQEGATLFMTLMAVFKVFLYRYSGQEDICVGTGIAGRQQQETEGLIGFFINTLALRSEVRGDASFTALLQQVKATTLEAYEHQEAPFEKVVDAVVKQRDMSRSPLVQVIFVLQNTPEVPELRLRELTLSGEGYKHTTAQFDLHLSITETAHGLQGSLEYSTDLFSDQTISQTINHYTRLLSSIVTDAEHKIGKLPMLTKAGEHQLLVEFNDTVVDYPKDNTIIDLFEKQVQQMPEAVALVFGEEQLTYGRLNWLANQLAHYLRNSGVKQEMLVPICIERSPGMIVGILGILKAGAAFVPIDPDYPSERISYMLEDSGATVVVTSQDSKSKLETAKALHIIELDGPCSVLKSQPAENVNGALDSHNLAYVIYTSGSTGKPKGVMIEHGGVVNLSLSQCDALRLKPKMKTLQFASFGFDASCYEIFNTLLSGGCLVLAKKHELLSAEGFEKLINNHNVELAVLPTSYQHTVKDRLGTIKTIVSAGEPLNEAIGSYIQSQGIRLINAYGPTENTVCVSLSDDPIKANHIIVIGKPISNMQVYILDKMDNLSPVGVTGEICVGGVQVSRGYLNLPELTAEKFVANPFSKEPGARIYKTGDLGRWLWDGNIEYLGRIDNQVKINGYRIEPGEIESVLEQSELVKQAVVLARENKGGNKRLVGYIVAEGWFDQEGIVSYVRARLPEYMLPALWVNLESMPLTPNGKIDRKALPDPDTSGLLINKYVAPRNEIEAKLAEIWQEVLEVDRIGIHDDFFKLGGNSLLALRMVSFIERNLLLSIPIHVVFQFTCISDLSKYLEIQLNLYPQEKDSEAFKLLNI